MEKHQSKRRDFMALAPILLLSACISPDPADTAAEKLAQIEHYQELWNSTSVSSDYSFNYQRNCFCPYSKEKIRIDVEDGVVTSFFRSPDSNWPEHTPERLVVTMEGIFERIEVLAKREASGDGTIEVEFDESVGNPTKVWWVDNVAYEGGFVLRIELIERQ